jgi:hypothetical protein
MAAALLATATLLAQSVGERAEGRGGTPDPALELLTGGKAIPPGPVQPTWDSLRADYRTPE